MLDKQLLACRYDGALAVLKYTILKDSVSVHVGWHNSRACLAFGENSQGPIQAAAAHP
jgi:hypothetical protein